MWPGKKTDSEADYQYFALFDSKVGHYREPILAVNRHDALRQITDIFRDPKHAGAQIVANAEDFQLFKVGEWDRKTGVMTGVPHEHIANLHEIKAAVMRTLTDAQRQLSIPIKDGDPTLHM